MAMGYLTTSTKQVERSEKSRSDPGYSRCCIAAYFFFWIIERKEKDREKQSEPTRAPSRPPCDGICLP
jgi:hypothetical protein